MPEPLQGVILLPRLRVENANTVSGPLTWGFPAITAITGFAHALARKLGGRGECLRGAGLVCHWFQPQISRAARYRPGRFNLLRHPPVLKAGKVEAAPIIEEGRAHLEITLLLGVKDYLPAELGEELAGELWKAALGMRLAGGSLWPGQPARVPNPLYLPLGEGLADQAEVFRKHRYRLLPGFALVDRPDIMQEHLREMQKAGPEANALDALLDLAALHHKPKPAEPAGEAGQAANPQARVEWKVERARSDGWLVPMPVGFAAISPLYEAGRVKNARDRQTPFRFVETVYSLGEWISPHRLENFRGLLWLHQARPEQGLYLCKTMDTVSKEK